MRREDEVGALGRRTSQTKPGPKRADAVARKVDRRDRREEKELLMLLRSVVEGWEDEGELA